MSKLNSNSLDHEKIVEFHNRNFYDRKLHGCLIQLLNDVTRIQVFPFSLWRLQCWLHHSVWKQDAYTDDSSDMTSWGWRQNLSMALSYHWGSLSLKPSRRLPLPSPGLGVGHSLIPDEIPWSSGLPFRLCTRESCLGEEREDWTLRRKPVGSTTVTSKALHDLAPGNFSDLIFFAAHLFILNPPGLLT